MKYVLDASVALKWVWPEPDSAKAILLRDSYRRGQDELIAPDVLLIETAYTLAKFFHRRLLTAPQAKQNVADISLVSPILYPSTPLVPRAFDIATNLRVSLYDALYVALAERESCQLVTADQSLGSALSGHINVVTLLSAIP